MPNKLRIERVIALSTHNFRLIGDIGLRTFFRCIKKQNKQYNLKRLILFNTHSFFLLRTVGQAAASFFIGTGKTTNNPEGYYIKPFGLFKDAQLYNNWFLLQHCNQQRIRVAAGKLNLKRVRPKQSSGKIISKKRRFLYKSANKDSKKYTL